MELFNSMLPVALADLISTANSAVDAFHNEVAEALPDPSRLQVIRQGIKVDNWLDRLGRGVTQTQKEAQKDLSEEIVREVRSQMKRDFVAAKDPAISKGKGCTARLE